ncbi:histidine phosphatase family protein [Humibacter antri]
MNKAEENTQAKSETRLTLVRHGETDWNRQRRIQGSTDVPLNAVGMAQARAAGLSLIGTDYVALYSSPQVRAVETARIIAETLGMGQPIVRDDLRERSFGPAEGLTDGEIAERFPHGIPDQESRESVVDRALPVLEEIADRHPGEAVLVVTHGAVIGSLVRRLSGDAHPLRGQPIVNLSLSHFTHSAGGLRVGDINVPSHDPAALTAE